VVATASRFVATPDCSLSPPFVDGSGLFEAMERLDLDADAAPAGTIVLDRFDGFMYRPSLAV
jgi:hypothetical protein